MKKLLILICCLLPLQAWAAKPLTYVSMNRDVSETNYTYCTLSDEIQGQDSLLAVSASTTVTSAVIADANKEAFARMTTGDIIIIYKPGSTITRTVTITNSHTLTVSGAAITVAAGTNWTWRKSTCGTGATNGTIDVVGCRGGGVMVNLATINAASITITVEGKVAGGTFAELFTPTAYTTTGNYFYPITELGQGLSSLRVGQKLATDGGAQDLTIIFACQETN